MKLIDLLNKIVNEEVPDNIKYQGYAWEWTGDDYKTFKYGEEKFLLSGREYNWVTEFLNNEVEIIKEEKEIEKLDIDKNDISWCEGNMKTDEDMVDIFLKTKDKINELIEAINSINKGK